MPSLGKPLCFLLLHFQQRALCRRLLIQTKAAGTVRDNQPSYRKGREQNKQKEHGPLSDESESERG